MPVPSSHPTAYDGSLRGKRTLDAYDEDGYRIVPDGVKQMRLLGPSPSRESTGRSNSSFYQQAGSVAAADVQVVSSVFAGVGSFVPSNPHEKNLASLYSIPKEIMTHGDLAEVMMNSFFLS